MPVDNLADHSGLFNRLELGGPAYLGYTVKQTAMLVLGAAAAALGIAFIWRAGQLSRLQRTLSTRWYDGAPRQFSRPLFLVVIGLAFLVFRASVFIVLGTLGTPHEENQQLGMPNENLQQGLLSDLPSLVMFVEIAYFVRCLDRVRLSLEGQLHTLSSITVALITAGAVGCIAVFTTFVLSSMAQSLDTVKLLRRIKTITFLLMYLCLVICTAYHAIRPAPAPQAYIQHIMMPKRAALILCRWLVGFMIVKVVFLAFAALASFGGVNSLSSDNDTSQAVFVVLYYVLTELLPNVLVVALTKPPPADAVRLPPLLARVSLDLHQNIESVVMPVASLELFNKLGVGSASVVYRARAGGEMLAVKRYLTVDDMDEDVRAQIVRDAESWVRISHPNLVRCSSLVLFPSTASSVGVLMELAHTDLHTWLHKTPATAAAWTWADAQRAALAILDGLAHLHTMHVVHGNLKSTNVLVFPNAVPSTAMFKLADYGLAKYFHPCRSVAQTAGAHCPAASQWMAPEVLANAPFSSASDVYSFGVILYELCTGRQPWPPSTPSIVTAVLTGQRPDIPPTVPAPLADTIRRCWAQSSGDRPLVPQLAADLPHLFHHLSVTRLVTEP